MLSKALQSILRRYFGEFITGLQNVELAFWTGKINIQNASFKHDKINQLLKLHNIPLTIKLSFLGSLEIDVPWNKLTSAPVQIKLSNVMIVFGLEKVMTGGQEEEDLSQNAKLLLIKNYLGYLLKKSEEAKAQQESQSGFLKKLLIKILHNLNLEISNIHIRIENHNSNIIQSPNNQDEFVDCRESDLGFSLGFCLEGVDAQTINSNNMKEFVKVESDRTQIRKRINLRQISLYWEESTSTNLFELPQEGKLNFLRGIINRKDYRLLTIDGQILMERGKDSFDYFFSTSFRLLEVGLTYDQLKQFIEVYQQFANAKTKKKITKLKEVQYSQQLTLQAEFKKVFRQLQTTNFNSVRREDIDLLESIDKKLLMKWTKEEVVQSIKQLKLREAFQNKNKKSWLGFLSKNTQQQLSPEDIALIEKEVSAFVKMIDQQSFGKTMGCYLHISLLRLVMDHHRVEQQLLFSAENIEVQSQVKKGEIKAALQISDVALTYEDLMKHAKVKIFQNYQSDGPQKYLVLRVQDSNQLQRVDLAISAMRFTHQIHFLSFLAELVKLRERERIRGEVAMLAPELKAKAVSKQPGLQESKVYQCSIRLSRLEVLVELSSSASLHAYIEAITISPSTTQRNSHSAHLTNLGIAYLQKEEAKDSSYHILEDLSIEVTLRKGLNLVSSIIPLLRLTLNEESLYYIIHCIQQQYAVLKVRSIEQRSSAIDEQKLLEGELSTISVFKAVNVYHCVLTADHLFYFEKPSGKVTYDKFAKKLLLKNMKASRLDALSFKLQSVFVNEILSCKDKEDADRWMYQLEQCIFDNSTRNQMFSMMEEEESDGSPHIFIPYDSHIQMQVNSLQILYEKNTQQKILGVQLKRLKVALKENNLQFQRRIDLHQIQLINYTLQYEQRDEYKLILSNTYNYFEDPNEDEEERSNIQVLIEGKKKTHPKYTGEVTIKSNINKLFINYDAEFLFAILHRLTVGKHKEAPLTEEAKNTNIFQMLWQILEQKNGIDERYENAKDFEFNRSYVELQHYKALYSCCVLFHVQLRCEEVEVFLVNGRNFHWANKFTAEGLNMQIDKSTDILFLKGSATTISLADITGYPKTTTDPFHQMEPYPIIHPLPARKHKKMLELAAGVFQPMAFINKQRFKNYFMLNLYDAEVNYQQQPLLRFVDFLTNQIILFILQPFSLHKYDTPHRGAYHFGPVNFTEQEVRKILYESVFPCFTHLNIGAFNLKVNFNTHPHDQFIGIFINRVSFVSLPETNPQRIHVRLDQLKRMSLKYPLLKRMVEGEVGLEERVNKSQWITRYLITAEGCRCDIIENEFNYEMYFQRSNNGDKDLLLPFLRIEKDLLMEGRIKNLSIHAPHDIYNLVNKCFLFNLAYDDQLDRLFNANHEFQHLNVPSKLIYRLLVNELSIVIPEVNQTVLVIQNCEYKFLKHQDTHKQMEVNGKSLHILGSEHNIITPFNLEQRQLGLEYVITMKPSGEKKMSAFIRQIDFHYHQEVIFPLFKYFLLDESCFPPQEVYTDIPLITCEVYLLNSYIKVLQSADYVYALKGDIKVVWTRYQQPHPENYRTNKALYPKDKDGSSYDIEFKGVTFRKYSKNAYNNLSSINVKEGNFYRSLSNSMVFSVNLTNVMRINNEVTYTDMVGSYNVNSLALKLSYKDYLEIVSYFQKEEQPQVQPQPQPQLPYTPHSKHKATIQKLSLQFGLSQLPVPLLDVCLQRSQIDVQLIGKTKVLTSKVEMSVGYWNMMIGRWEPLVERSSIQLTLKQGQFEKYLMATSGRPLLLNFSVESLKVLTLIWQDISEKGNLHVINKQERAKGVQISPYVITNRTGFSIIVHSDFTLTAKLRNNEKMHLQSRSVELDQNFSTVTYQIEGDSTLYPLNLNLNQTHRPSITYNREPYRLVVSAVATPVLKEIVISAPYVIHNRTVHALVMVIGGRQYEVEAEGRVPVPFTEQLHEGKVVRLEFPHLRRVTDNFSFEFRDIQRGYEHYIVHEESQTFNCLISLQAASGNVIAVSPLVGFCNLLPLGVTVEVAIRKLNREKAVLREEVGVNQEKLFYQFGSKDEVQLRLHLRGFNPSEFVTLNLANNRNQPQINADIMLVDCRGLQAAIHSRIIKKDKQKRIYVFADTVLINQTNAPLFIFQEALLLAGQPLKDIPESHSKYVLAAAEVDEPAVGLTQEDPSQSRKFKTRELGDQVLTVVNKSQLHELVISSSMNCLSEKAQVFTSVVKIAPRFILVNLTSRPLAFRQQNTDQNFLLGVGQRKDWYWHLADQERRVMVSSRDQEIEEEGGWDFSAPFALETLEETVLVVRPKGNSEVRLLLKTEVFKQGQQVFVSFKELAGKEDSLIRIRNNLKLVNLEIQQEALLHVSPPWERHRHFNCPALSEADFGWDYLEEQPKLHFTFLFIGPYRSRFDTSTLTLSLDDIQTRPLTKEFKGDNEEVLAIEISMQIVGLRKTIVISSKDQSQASVCDEELMQSMAGNKVGVSLLEIGVSIIGGRVGGHRSELVFVSVRKLDLIMTEKQQKRNCQLRIKYLNIDNNLNHNTMYPVLFTPLRHRKTLDKARPFFVCLLQQNLKTKQLTQINYLRLCMEPISFKIYDEMISHLYNFYTSCTQLRQREQGIDLRLLFKEGEAEWLGRSLVKQGASTFLREVQIGKVVVQLSFSMRPTFKGNIILHTMLSLFGSAFTNVSESQMRLSRFLRRNLSLGELGGQLGAFYQKEGMGEMYKIAGAINIFGNPYVFIKYLAEGAWEIVNQPSEGFIKGPIEGAIGIGRGGVFFLRNVVAATFNSFEAVSESCSRGLAYITFDQKFITRREKIQMQKSKHIVHGTKSALWALFTGVEVALSGVVRHPREERRRSGAAGVVKGVALGLAGLITKPLSGFFQAVSKFSEGVKQTALFFQDGPNVTRSRPPRVFVSGQEYYSEYSLDESKAINLLEFHSTKHLQKTILLVAVDQQAQDCIYTVVTSEYLVQLSKANREIIREIKLGDISEVESEESGGRRGVRVRFNEHQVLILTHKHRQLYECFKEIFAQIDQEQDEQYYEQEEP